LTRSLVVIRVPRSGCGTELADCRSEDDVVLEDELVVQLPMSTLSARPLGDNPVRHTIAPGAVDWIASTTSGAPMHPTTMSGSADAQASRTEPLW
jgi:hypothetical protein